MFENARAAAVIAASDLARARSFYEGVLGLKVRKTHRIKTRRSFTSWVGLGSWSMSTSFAGTAKNTVFAIDTDDLARDMAVLRDKGVVFMDYDFPGLTTVDGVAELGGEKTCWFEDSEGNILALSERLSRDVTRRRPIAACTHTASERSDTVARSCPTVTT